MTTLKRFSLDRTAFEMNSHREMEKRTIEYWKTKTAEERLSAAAYLISVAYNYSEENPPRMDRTVHSAGKM